MTTASINIAALKALNREGLLRELAVFMKVKSIFSNGCFFDATHVSVSRKSGISLSVIKRCVPLFLERGWCRRDGKNLIFNNVRVVDKTTRLTDIFDVQHFKILDKESYKVVFKKLRLLLVKDIHDAFEFKKKQSNDYLIPDKNTSLSDYKSARQAYREGKLVKLISASERFTISNRKVGSLFKRSKSTGSRIMSFGQKVGMVELQKNIIATTIVGVDPPEEFRRRGYFLCPVTNVVLKQSCNFARFI